MDDYCDECGWLWDECECIDWNPVDDDFEYEVDGFDFDDADEYIFHEYYVDEPMDTGDDDAK